MRWRDPAKGADIPCDQWGREGAGRLGNAMTEQRIGSPSLSSRLAQLLRFRSGDLTSTISACAAVAALSTAFFFFLHHLANQIPFDLAKLRFADAVESAPWDDGVTQRFKSDFTYCQIAATILADAAKQHDLPLSAVATAHLQVGGQLLQGGRGRDCGRGTEQAEIEDALLVGQQGALCNRPAFLVGT